jgi:hypothetical protein
MDKVWRLFRSVVRFETERKLIAEAARCATREAKRRSASFYQQKIASTAIQISGVELHRSARSYFHRGG